MSLFLGATIFREHRTKVDHKSVFKRSHRRGRLGTNLKENLLMEFKPAIFDTFLLKKKTGNLQLTQTST